MLARTLVILAALVLLAAAPAPPTDAAVTVTVTVTDLRNENGRVGVALYDEDARADFPDAEPLRAESAVVEGTAVEFRFLNVPEGRYAVAVTHDENDNGMMDSNAWGIPVEGFGFSNDVMGEMGPPSFERAAFAAEEDTQISVSMLYMAGD